MNVRVIGSAALVRALHSILEGEGASGRVYASRKNARDARLYLDVDDAAATRILDRAARARRSAAAPRSALALRG